MRYVLAVDAGNTKTIALIASHEGVILGAGRGGCGDIYDSIGAAEAGQSAVEMALANIDGTIKAALQAAGITSDDITASAFNMSGADWPEDYALLESAMRERGLGPRIHIQNDALGVLHSGSLHDVGVSVVCGTGAATGARGPDGRVWHASFWLQVGGSVDLAHKALNAVFRTELGLEEPTTLTARFLEFFQKDSVEDLLHHLSNREQRVRGPLRVDVLTPLLLNEAEAGDRVALRIVQEHGHALGKYAQVAAQRVGIEGTAFQLVLAGGVFRHPSSILPDAITEQIRISSPQAQPTRSRFEPVVGTLFTALEMAGSVVDTALVDRLVPTLPDAMLFETERPDIR